MSFIIDPAFHMWFAIILTVVAFYFFSSDKLPLEVTAVSLLTALLLLGSIFPLDDGYGNNLLNAKHLLMGFANPSLIAVLALLVIGQAMVQTAALTPITKSFLRLKNKMAYVGLISIFIFVLVVSAFMNNTPLVIIAIPVLQALAMRLDIPDSRLMIPLSYIAILGGMMTLVGSSTNMLVSTALLDLGYEGFSFFEFTIPGAILAGVGAIYVFFILPRILPNRSSMSKDLEDTDKTFIAELDIKTESKLIGQACPDGHFGKLPEITVRLVQRQGHLILPPFEDYQVEERDIMIVAATRQDLMDLLSTHPGFLLSEKAEADTDIEEANGINSYEDADLDESTDKKKAAQETEEEGTHVLAEIMVPPTSRIVDQSIKQIDFEKSFGCMVLGIQRKARIIRRRINQMRLEAGDVLLITGDHSSIEKLREDTEDVIVMSGSRRDIPDGKKAPYAALIFLATIISAATGMLSITVASVTGAVAMMIFGCLNVRQMMRAFDSKIYFLVGSALALGVTLQETGGAVFIADILLSLPIIHDPFYAAILLFILIAIATNLLTNNACAILFTPIALNLATEIGADPMVFAITVVFATNCSFASPIGYQTNLLVMGPGHYRFKDFIKAGVPLILILWVAYCFIAKYYFHL